LLGREIFAVVTKKASVGLDYAFRENPIEVKDMAEHWAVFGEVDQVEVVEVLRLAAG
jgi:hypothetical protein